MPSPLCLEGNESIGYRFGSCCCQGSPISVSLAVGSKCSFVLVQKTLIVSVCTFKAVPVCFQISSNIGMQRIQTLWSVPVAPKELKRKYSLLVWKLCNSPSVQDTK